MTSKPNVKMTLKHLIWTFAGLVLGFLETGSVHAQKVEHEVFDSRPAWSPDGKQIAFVSRGRNGVAVNELYVMNSDGSLIRQMTHDGYYKKRASWSPDGKRLAYAGARDDQWFLFLMNIHGTDPNPVRLIEGHEPSWSPNGAQIIFHATPNGAPELFVYDLKTEKVSKLETGRPESWEPTWTKDNQILFIAPLFTDAQEFYQIDLNTKDTKRITRNETREFGGTFSPDQSQLAYAAHRNNNWDIYVLDLETTKEYRLTFHEADDLFPCWSPEGNKILFQSERGPGRSLFTILVDGTHLRKIGH